MNIPSILKDQCLVCEIEELTPSSVTFDSQEVINGTLFICKGASFKREYLLEAINRGAIAYLSEVDYKVDIPLILVKDIRKSMVLIGNEFYDYPQNKLKLIGVTGTKGKTTTVYLIKHLFKDKIGLLSSIEVYDGKETQESILTTPEYLDILKTFRAGLDNGLDKFVLEVSSQALKVGRVEDLTFDVGIFLNISPDHISDIEHPDFNDYLASKLALFKQTKTAIINANSEHFDEVKEAAKQATNVITFGNEKAVDYQIHDVVSDHGIISFMLNEKHYDLDLIGHFNIENKAATIITGKLLGLDEETISDNLKEVRIPGRMELFESHDRKVKVIVDYAHNALSFERLFKSIKLDYPDHDVVIIFGSAGGKAFNRRKDLGLMANQYADKAYLCCEDPNYEDPIDIAKDIANYLTDIDYEIIEDRKDAFLSALNQAKEKTVILFVGKGDEPYQKIKGQLVTGPSDVSIVKEALKSR